MLTGKKTQYFQVGFDNEAEIESVVADNYDIIFGSSAIYIPQQSIKTKGGKGTVPDAVVINPESMEWYNVEVELGHHGTWAHIAPQVSKQLAAIATIETKELLIKNALNIVKKNSDLLEALQELGIEEINLHARLNDTLKKLPIVAIPIDNIPADLSDWAKTLKHDVKIWTIQKYSEKSSNQILYLLPDDIPSGIEVSSDEKQISETKLRGGRQFQELLATGAIKPGDKLWMQYGPKGKPKKKYWAVIREDGLEIEGRIYSLSYASLVCMHKAGSKRRAVNGWLKWKTVEGVVLDDLFKEKFPPENAT